MRSREEISNMLNDDKSKGSCSQYLVELTIIEILLDIREQNNLIIEHLKHQV